VKMCKEIRKNMRLLGKQPTEKFYNVAEVAPNRYRRYLVMGTDGKIEERKPTKSLIVFLDKLCGRAQYQQFKKRAYRERWNIYGRTAA